MNNFIAFIVLLSISTFLNAEGWVLKPSCDPERTIIEYRLNGNQTFSEALNDVPLDTSSFSIRALCCINSSNLKQVNEDLARYYHEKIPDEFEKAISSSANLHNPALLPLSNNLTAALRESRLLKNIEYQLSQRSYSITRFEYEKFMMFNRENPYEFHVDIRLRIEKDASQK